MKSPENLSVKDPAINFSTLTGMLEGRVVKETTRFIGDLAGIFLDENARSACSQDKIVYQVQMYMPVEEGTEGGLFFGNTTLYPGMIGNEYFMTKGHFHAKPDRTEYYWCIMGKGMLVLMDADRNTRAENIFKGSLHFIPPFTAHRVVNTGKDKLVLGACWPADAGHNYRDIEYDGFGARVLEIDGAPELISSTGLERNIKEV